MGIFSSADLNRRIEFDKHGRALAASAAEALLAKWVDAEGDKDRIPTRDEFEALERLKNGRQRWVDVWHNLEGEVTEKWIRTYAPWAVGIMLPILNNPQRSVEEEKLLYGWAVTQKRAGQDVRVVPYRVSNAMGDGKMMAFKYEPVNPDPHALPVIIPAPSLAGALFLAHLGIEYAKAGHVAVTYSGPSAHDSDGAKFIQEVATDYRAGFGYVPGAMPELTLGKMFDNVLIETGIVDLRDLQTQTVEVLGYSYGGNQFDAIVREADLAHRVAKYIDVSGGRNIREDTDYALFVKIAQQLDSEGTTNLADLFGEGFIPLFATLMTNTTDENAVYLTALELLCSTLNESIMHNHHEAKALGGRGDTVPYEWMGQLTAVVLPDDELVDAIGNIRELRRLYRGKEIIVHVLGSNQGLCDELTREGFVVTKCKNADPKWYSHTFPMSLEAGIELVAAAGNLRVIESKSAQNLVFPWGQLEFEAPYKPANVSEASHDALVKVVEELLISSQHPFPDAFQAGFFTGGRYQKFAGRVAYYVAVHFPDRMNEGYVRKVILDATNTLRTQNGDKPLEENFNTGVRIAYLSAYERSIQKYIMEHKEGAPRIAAFEIAKLRAAYMALTEKKMPTGETATTFLDVWLKQAQNYESTTMAGRYLSSNFTYGIGYGEAGPAGLFDVELCTPYATFPGYRACVGGGTELYYSQIVQSDEALIPFAHAGVRAWPLHFQVVGTLLGDFQAGASLGIFSPYPILGGSYPSLSVMMPRLIYGGEGRRTTGLQVLLATTHTW